MDPDLVFRGVLAAAAFSSILLAASFFGTIAPDRNWPIRTVCAGLWLVLVYVSIGQVKAFNLTIQVDWVTYFGIVAYAVLDLGLVWFHVHERRSRRGR